MSFLKRLLRGSSYDPLAPSTLAADTPGTATRSPIARAGEILASLGARPEVDDEYDSSDGSRTWVRVDGATTERYTVRVEGDAVVSIDVADASRVPGPGVLEEAWSREVDSQEFSADTNPTTPIVRMIEAECSADIANLAAALDPKWFSDLTFFTFSLSPTGHTSLTLFLDAERDRDLARVVERIPAAMPPLRDVAHSMRSATVARLDELFPWYTGSPSFTVPANPGEYLERAARILDPIAKEPSTPADDPSCVSWTWSDPIATNAEMTAFVDSATGSVGISFGCGVEQLDDDSAYIEWIWQPASSTWKQDDLYDDDPVVQAYLARFGQRVPQLLDLLATDQAHEFTIGTDRAGNVNLHASIDMGEDSIEHTAAVSEHLRSNLDALRS